MLLATRSRIKDVKALVREGNDRLKAFFRIQRKEILKKRSGPILVVDDVKEQADIIESFVKMAKVDLVVVWARSVAEAKKRILSNEPIRVAIIDVNIDREKDGLALIEWIKGNAPDLPYVILTGLSKRVEEIEDTDPGADVLVKGSTSLDELADAIGIRPLKAGEIVPTDASIC